jgi:diadenosine tetraphosphatase ApaH/serine/threonine PP2A family protein phosphatase
VGTVNEGVGRVKVSEVAPADRCSVIADTDDELRVDAPAVLGGVQDRLEPGDEIELTCAGLAGARRVAWGSLGGHKADYTFGLWPPPSGSGISSMRILVLADIHANLAALDAVLADAKLHGVMDRIWVLGDTIGYGPQPDECLDRMRQAGALVVAGNHEKAAIGELDVSIFNPYAAEALTWTAGRLSTPSKQYIRGLPVRLEDHGVTLVHASPRDPMWEYIMGRGQALENLRAFSTKGWAAGHTHVPVWLSLDKKRPAGGVAADGSTAQVGASRFYFNPGSVGQPRDGDPRASYAVFNTEERSVAFHRIEYDVEVTQKLMSAAGLPEPLVLRLAAGR